MSKWNVDEVMNITLFHVTQPTATGLVPRMLGVRMVAAAQVSKPLNPPSADSLYPGENKAV